MTRRAQVSTQNTKPDWPVLDGQSQHQMQQRCCCWHRSFAKTGPVPTPDAYVAGSGAIRGALRSAKRSSVQNPRWALCHVRQESASTSGQTAHVTILRNMISPLVRQKNSFSRTTPAWASFPVSLCNVRNRTQPPSQASSDGAGG
jgi:hypothetical protein